MSVPTLSDDPREPDAAPLDVLDTPEAGPRVIRGASLRSASYLISTLLATLSAPLLTRHLGQVGYGEYYAVGSLVGLVSGLTEGGLGSIGTREYAMLTGTRRWQFMGNLLGMRLAFVAVGLTAGLVFAALEYSSVLVVGSAIASVGVLIGVATSTFAVPVYTELLVARQVSFELCAQIVSMVLMVALVVLGAGLPFFLAIPIPAGLMLLVLTARVARGRAPLRPFGNFPQWWEIVRETYPVAASSAVQTLYMRSVILVMTLVAPPAVWGTYAYSVRVMEILSALPVLLVGTAFPVIARAVRDDRARLEYVIRRTLLTGLIIGIGMTLCVELGAGAAMAVLTGHAGGPAAAVLRIQAPALLLVFLSASWGSVLIALRRHHALLASSAIAMLLTVGLTAWLVPIDGAMGGGIASLVGELALVLTMTWALWRRDELPFALHGAPRVLACAGVATGAALLAPIPDVARVALFIALYGAFLLGARAVPEEIIDALLDLVRRRREDEPTAG